MRTAINNIKRNIKEQLGYDPQLVWKNRIIRRSGGQVIHCIGDSHLGAFIHVAKKSKLYRTCFEFCMVQGATAMGIPNPNSLTQAGPLFNTYISHISRKDRVLTCLGEVDCRFVIWYQHQKYGTSISSLVDKSYGNYINLVNELQSITIHKLIVVSIPLPTIKDGQIWREVANLRKEVFATLKERTELTLHYNQ